MSTKCVESLCTKDIPHFLEIFFITLRLGVQAYFIGVFTNFLVLVVVVVVVVVFVVVVIILLLVVVVVVVHRVGGWPLPLRRVRQLTLVILD